MGAGGDSWASAGTLALGPAGLNTYTRTDSAVGTAAPFFPAWWTYTPTTSGIIVLDTFATSAVHDAEADTQLAVYTGTVDAPVLVAFNDDAGSGRLLSRLVVDVTAGVEYHVLVGTYDDTGDSIDTYSLTAEPVFSAWYYPGQAVPIDSGTGIVVVQSGGASPWRDGRDTTYTLLDAAVPSGVDGIEALISTHAVYDPADIVGARLHFRASSTDFVGSGVLAYIYGGDSGTVVNSVALDNVTGSPTIEPPYPGSGVPGDFTALFDDAALVEGVLTDVAPPLLHFALLGGTGNFKIIEAAVEVFVTTQVAALAIPPLRQHPRSDGLGTSSARRLYPTTPSVQASNRRAGGYI